jgi:16S rRNA processing protein RimM
MVVQGERERLIPFVRGPIVKSVDSQAKKIVVDWAPEY